PLGCLRKDQGPITQTVLSCMVTEPRLSRSAPSGAVLPHTTPSSILRVPEAPLKIPPPVEPAVLPDRVHSWGVVVPRLKMPPPESLAVSSVKVLPRTSSVAKAKL